DFAEIEIFLLNYKDTSQGVLNLRTGWIGEVRYGKGRFVAEVRGLMQSLSRVIGELYSPSCRAKLGDSRCGINMAGLTVTGAVTSVTNNPIFKYSGLNQASVYFNMGKITFASGNNAGLSMEVKDFRGTQLTLVFPMPYTVQAGDEYTM